MPSEPKNAPDLSSAVVRDETKDATPQYRCTCNDPHFNECYVAGHTAKKDKQRLCACGHPWSIHAYPHAQWWPTRMPCVRSNCGCHDFKEPGSVDDVHARLLDLILSRKYSGDSLQTAIRALIAAVRKEHQSALDALAVAVKGCGHDYRTTTGFYQCGDRTEVTIYLCGECSVLRDAATTSLLDGRTTT